MSQQENDKLVYDGKCYEIIESRMRLRFDPMEYGLKPSEVLSTIARGYLCEYIVADEQLYLDNLNINTEDDYYPEINGIAPLTNDQNILFWNGHHIYSQVHIPVAYTGNLLIADQSEIIRQKPYGFGADLWEYRTLISLTFENGILTDRKDHSRLGAAIRAHILNSNDLKEYSFMGMDEKRCLYDAGFHVWWMEKDPREDEGWKRFCDRHYVRSFMQLCQQADFDKGKALQAINHIGINTVFEVPSEYDKGGRRCTFLELAVQANNLPLIEFLFENGADPNLIDPEKSAEVVFWDLQYLWEDDWNEDDRLQIAELFLEHGANPRLVIEGEDLLSYLNFALGYIEDYGSKQYYYRERFEKLLLKYDGGGSSVI